MNSFKNSVQLIGNLGQDVELKDLDSGRMLAKVSLATKDYYKNNKGEKVEDVQWHQIVAWGKTAELMSQSLSKGEQVLVQGKLTYNSYEKDGEKRYFTQVVANHFLRLNTKNVDSKIPF